jgi:hypothetical protein
MLLKVVSKTQQHLITQKRMEVKRNHTFIHDPLGRITNNVRKNLVEFGTDHL